MFENSFGDAEMMVNYYYYYYYYYYYDWLFVFLVVFDWFGLIVEGVLVVLEFIGNIYHKCYRSI